LVLVLWRCGKQATISRSTAEAEYVAAGVVAREVQYMHAFARELRLDTGCIHIGIENSAALSLIADPISAARTKHNDVVYHHVRERIKCKQMSNEKIATEINVSDIFTKPLLGRTVLSVALCVASSWLRKKKKNSKSVTL
jgi:hypothetical protein